MNETREWRRVQECIRTVDDPYGYPAIASDEQQRQHQQQQPFCAIYAICRDSVGHAETSPRGRTREIGQGLY